MAAPQGQEVWLHSKFRHQEPGLVGEALTGPFPVGKGPALVRQMCVLAKASRKRWGCRGGLRGVPGRGQFLAGEREVRAVPGRRPQRRVWRRPGEPSVRASVSAGSAVRCLGGALGAPLPGRRIGKPRPCRKRVFHGRLHSGSRKVVEVPTSVNVRLT